MVGVIGSLAAIGPVLASRGLALPIGRNQGALILAVGLAIPVALVGRPLAQDSQFQPARSVSDAVRAALLSPASIDRTSQSTGSARTALCRLGCPLAAAQGRRCILSGPRVVELLR